MVSGFDCVECDCVGVEDCGDDVQWDVGYWGVGLQGESDCGFQEVLGGGDVFFDDCVGQVQDCCCVCVGECDGLIGCVEYGDCIGVIVVSVICDCVGVEQSIVCLFLIVQ